MRSLSKLLLRASLIAAIVVIFAALPATGRRATAAGPCDAGPTFNLSTCTAAYGLPYYCQVGSVGYNAALCAQNTASTSATGCAPGTAAAICLLTGQNAGSIYCQVGTASYNAALCAQAGGLNATTACPAGQNSLACFLAGSNTSIYCQVGSASYNQTLCAQSVSQLTVAATPVVVAAAAQAGPTASSITVTAPPTPLNCGGASRITALSATPGATLSFATSLGDIVPATAVDQGGGASAVFMAPEKQGGVAIIKVTSGAASGTAQITVNCAAAPVAPAAAPVAVAPVAPQIPPQLVISPPNTGDGGLKPQD